jgi:hypothetical protein
MVLIAFVGGWLIGALSVYRAVKRDVATGTLIVGKKVWRVSEVSLTRAPQPSND